VCHICSGPQTYFREEMFQPDPHATTLTVKMSKKMTYQELLVILDDCCTLAVPELPQAYDFVHLPWKKLAVVNFVSPKICTRCSWILLLMSHEEGCPVVGLKQADHQGFVENLALCQARARESVHYPEPMVFAGHGLPFSMELRVKPIKTQTGRNVLLAMERGRAKYKKMPETDLPILRDGQIFHF
ncbi:Uncharacterized protein SCF082_LOCUS48926, partial [Durusdinium trenchii]